MWVCLAVVVLLLGGLLSGLLSGLLGGLLSGLLGRLLRWHLPKLLLLRLCKSSSRASLVVRVHVLQGLKQNNNYKILDNFYNGDLNLTVQSKV